jgi:hypothetical protein
MSEAASGKTEERHPLVCLMERYGVHKIAVIDDAFDVPSISDIPPDERDDFWEAIEANETAKRELNAITRMTITSSADINDILVESLWNNRDSLQVTKILCDTKLFRTTLERQYQLDPFIKLLQDLKCSVITAGKDASLADPDIKLIFLDYYLVPAGTDNDIEMALEAVARIHHVYVEAKPFIILMSGTRLPADSIEEFRKRSELLAGTFSFVPKDELVDRTSLYLKLWQLVTGLPFGSAIHCFVKAIKDSLSGASQAWLEGIRKLSLSDYAYIQKLSLQDEGQPLGDYLLWLYGSYFAQLLFNSEQVRHHRDIIDKLSIGELPLGQIDPSLQLKFFYSSAMFDLNVGPLSIHPRSGADQPGQPYLQLGDIFARDPGNDILIVINAQCDLIYTPDTPKRQFHENRTILFVHGKFYKIWEQ